MNRKDSQTIYHEGLYYVYKEGLTCSLLGFKQENIVSRVACEKDQSSSSIKHLLLPPPGQIPRVETVFSSLYRGHF